MIDRNRPVRVFKNRKRGCYSIMQAGRLRASAKQVRLGDVEFRVREPGRQRMLRERKINVHAFAIGRLLEYVHASDNDRLEALEGRAVFYDPYRYASFVDQETKAPVLTAEVVQFDEHGVVYSGV